VEKSAFSCASAKSRERVTAAEYGTHVYLNSKMMQEFTLLLLGHSTKMSLWYKSHVEHP
jgi:hypothetical protein